MANFSSNAYFKQLVSFMQEKDNAYACIAINNDAETKVFIRHCKKHANEKNIVTLDCLKKDPMDLLEAIPESANDVIILYHMETSVQDDVLEQLIHRLADFKMQRKGLVFFVFVKWFLEVLYRKAPDFCHNAGSQADFTNQGDEAVDTNSYMHTYYIPLSQKETILAIVNDASQATSLRLKRSFDLITLLRQNLIRDEEVEETIVHLAESKVNDDYYAAQVLLLYFALAEFYSTLGIMDLSRHYQYLAISFSSPESIEPLEQIFFNNLKAAAHLNDSHYDKALEIANDNLSFACSHDCQMTLDAAATHFDMAKAYQEKGQYTKAMESIQKALEIQLPILGEQHLFIASTYSCIGDILVDLGEFKKAIEQYRKAQVMMEKTLGRRHPNTAIIYGSIALAMHYDNQQKPALRIAQKALQINDETLASNHESTLVLYNTLGLINLALKDYQAALDYFQKDLEGTRKTHGENNTETATTYHNIGLAYCYMKDFEQSLKYYEKALAIREKTLGPSHPDTALTYCNIAIVYNLQEDYKTAAIYHNIALSIQEKSLGKDHPDTKDSEKWLIGDVDWYLYHKNPFKNLDPAIRAKYIELKKELKKKNSYKSMGDIFSELENLDPIDSSES